MKSLEKIDVISLAKIQALIGLIFGFLYGVLVFISEKLVIPPTLNLDSNIQPIGAFAFLLGPLIGLIYGFLAGIFIAFFYNLFAKLVGGIKIELKEK